MSLYGNSVIARAHAEPVNIAVRIHNHKLACDIHYPCYREAVVQHVFMLGKVVNDELIYAAALQAEIQLILYYHKMRG